MEQIYRLTLADSETVIYCRKKKHKLTCVSEDGQLYLRFAYIQALILEECVFATHWSYADAMKPAFSEWVRSILDPCSTLAFYCFPQAGSMDIPYVWTIAYSMVESVIPWDLGIHTQYCASLPSLTADLEECEEAPVSWYPPDETPTPENVILWYT
jgi:hypothetical protein